VPPETVLSAGTWEQVVAAYAEGRQRLDHLPRVLCVEPTDGCNFACTSCPRPDGKAHLLDAADLAGWVDQQAAAFRAAPVWLHFSGESLLHPRLDELMRTLRERGVRMMLSTNASRLDDRRGEMLLGSGLDLLVFSLDAAVRETYERIRVGGDFDEVRGNVHRFLALRGSRPRPATQAQLVLSDQPLAEVLEFVHTWVAAGVDAVHLKRYSTRAGQLAMPSGQTADDRPVGRCLDPWLNVVIRADGSVVPCCADFAGRLVLGSLHTQTLTQIWNGERARALRRAHVEGGAALPAACRNCSDVRTPEHTESVTRRTTLPADEAELRALLGAGPRHLLFDVRPMTAAST
jgi:radical SAM protein with 4Fe4S-binding SPASM domain